MVSKIDLKISLSREFGFSENAFMAVSIFYPDSFDKSAMNSIIFALPGGGYTREYYDLQVPGRNGYSMARYLANDGYIVVTCDPPGVGDSSTADFCNDLYPELLASANHATVEQISKRIISGDLIEEFPSKAELFIVGLGHSMGAGVIISQQAKYASYDAVALLGPAAPSSLLSRIRTHKNMKENLSKIHCARRMLNDVKCNHLDGAVNTEDQRVREFYEYFIARTVPNDLVTFDSKLFWAERSRQVRTTNDHGKWNDRHNASNLRNFLNTLFSIPRLATAHRASRQRLQSIDVPIFLGYGEQDVSLEPHRDVAMFRSSADVSLYVLSDSSHCHNYSNSRECMFRKLSVWIAGVAQSSLARTN